MVEQRVNYFDGQFLKVDDFQDEQAYHVDRERRPFKALISPGVCEGLNVRIKDGNTSQVTVAIGMAIDSKGRQLVLDSEEDYQIPDNILGETNAEYYLYVFYPSTESTTESAGNDEPSGDRRINEHPSFNCAMTVPTDGIQLAMLSISDGSINNVADNERVYAGWQLPNGNGDGGTLKYQSEAEKAEFEGALEIKGDLTVDGAVSATGDLTVEGAVSATGVTVEGAVSATGDLTVEGAVSATGVTVEGAVSATGDLTVEGAVSATGVTVEGAVSATGDLTVEGAVSATGVTVDGAVSATSLVLGESYELNGAQPIEIIQFYLTISSPNFTISHDTGYSTSEYFCSVVNCFCNEPPIEDNQRKFFSFSISTSSTVEYSSGNWFIIGSGQLHDAPTGNWILVVMAIPNSFVYYHNAPGDPINCS